MLYPTATEWICLNAVLEEHWTRLCVAIDRVDLLADTRFETHEARSRNRDELAGALLEAVFKTTDADPGWTASTRLACRARSRWRARWTRSSTTRNTRARVGEQL